jgi:hypothetical protein
LHVDSSGYAVSGCQIVIKITILTLGTARGPIGA